MKIQPINLLCKPNKPCFLQNEKRQNVDRAATVQDLYEMEDRIKQYQKDLFESQNRKLSEAFYYTNDLIYAATVGHNDLGYSFDKIENNFENAQKSANKFLA